MMGIFLINIYPINLKKLDFSNNLHTYKQGIDYR